MERFFAMRSIVTVSALPAMAPNEFDRLSSSATALTMPTATDAA